MKRCPFCDGEIEETAAVCPHCGRALADQPAPAPPPARAAAGVATPRTSLVPWLAAGVMAMVATGAVVALMLTGRAQPATSHEPLYRAAQAVTAGVSIGVNYDEYRNLVQALATEVLVARDAAAGPREQSIASAFSSVLEAHKSALTVWRQKVDTPPDVPTDQLDQAIQEAWRKADAALAAAVKSYGAR